MKHRGRYTAGSFGFGVAVLSVSAVLVKLSGLLLKIPMMSLLGAEGMGYFNAAYEVYALLCVLATAGMPTALSVLIASADARGDGEAIARLQTGAMRLFLCFGFLGSVFLCAFAKPITHMLGNPASAQGLAYVAPALLFVCASGAMRGYFQGVRRMLPVALSQVVEALGKLVFGVGLAAWGRERGLPLSACSAYAILGVSIGAMLSALYLYVSYRRDRCVRGIRRATPTGELGSLLALGLPITVGSALMGLSRILDMVLILRRLPRAGVPYALANEAYGAYTTMALPVFGLIPALLAPISSALVPSLSAAISSQNEEEQRRVTLQALRLTVLVATPAALGLSVFAEPILLLLFPTQQAAVSATAPLLSALAASVLLSCLIATLNALLQAYRMTVRSAVAVGIGIAVKAIVSYVLLGASKLGMLGAPLGTLACDLTVTLLGVWYLCERLPSSGELMGVCLRPLPAGLLAVGGAAWVYGRLSAMPHAVSLVACVGLAVVLYGILAFVFGALRREDLRTVYKKGS